MIQNFTTLPFYGFMIQIIQIQTFNMQREMYYYVLYHLKSCTRILK